ncbi:hypothetical protein WJX82_004515 [Trebouxia sp. C0006]
MEGTAARHPARIQVSNTKKPVFFYVNLAKRFLQEHGEVQLSALGLAISSMVTVAEILKNSRLAVEQKITTGLDAFNDDGRERAGSHVVCSVPGKQDAYKAMRQDVKDVSHQLPPGHSCPCAVTSCHQTFACKYYGMLYRDME